MHVALKDKVPPSNACQHAKELVDIVRANYSEDGVSAKDPIMFLYSDGGRDHRTTFRSVKTAAIYIFMALDLDTYIAALTASNQSYRNPAEHVMSMLNLGLQNIATARESIEPTKEIRMKSLGTLKKIREASKSDPSLSKNLEASIKPVLDLISNRFSQLKYSGNPIQMEAPVDQDDESSFVDLFPSIFHVEDEVVEQSFAYISEGTITTFARIKGFHGKAL